MTDLKELNLFLVRLKDSYDAIKGLELRLWAQEQGFRILSIARGEIPTMYVRATREGMEFMKAKFDFIDNYKTAMNLIMVVDE
jgi:hypothetical protein